MMAADTSKPLPSRSKRKPNTTEPTRSHSSAGRRSFGGRSYSSTRRATRVTLSSGSLPMFGLALKLPLHLTTHDRMRRAPRQFPPAERAVTALAGELLGVDGPLQVGVDDRHVSDRAVAQRAAALHLHDLRGARAHQLDQAHP